MKSVAADAQLVALAAMPLPALRELRGDAPFLRDDSPAAAGPSSQDEKRQRKAEAKQARREKQAQREHRKEARAAAAESSAAPAAAAGSSATPDDHYRGAGLYGNAGSRLAELGDAALADERLRADDADLGDALQCPICTEPLCLSVAPRECGHILCEACLLDAARHARQQLCPLCRTPWSLATLVRRSDTDALVEKAYPAVAARRARAAFTGRAERRNAVRILEEELQLQRERRAEASRAILEEEGESEGEGEDEPDDPAAFARLDFVVNFLCVATSCTGYTLLTRVVNGEVASGMVGGVGMTARLVAGAAYLGPLVYFVWFILRGRVALFWWSRFEAVDAFAPFEIAPAQLYREPKPGPILLGVVFGALQLGMGRNGFSEHIAYRDFGSAFDVAYFLVYLFLWLYLVMYLHLAPREFSELPFSAYARARLPTPTWPRDLETLVRDRVRNQNPSTRFAAMHTFPR